MGSECRGKGELLSFPPRLATKADELKNTDTGLRHHGIAGMVTLADTSPNTASICVVYMCGSEFLRCRKPLNYNYLSIQ